MPCQDRFLHPMLHAGSLIIKKKKNKGSQKESTKNIFIYISIEQVWSHDPMLFYYLFAMFPKPNRTETRSSLDPSHPTDLFFVEVMGVPPPKTRPCQMTGDIMTLHPQSTALEKVIETIVILKQIMQVNKEQHLILIILIRRCSFFWQT